MNTIDVCFTPDLIHLYPVEEKIIVVVDILRATSCMTTAFAHGVESIIPVASVEECKYLQEHGHLAAAERNGIMIEGFDLGNSPFSYMSEDIRGKSIAVTTTNGTIAISKSKRAKQLLIGSFLNLGAIVAYLKKQQEDILVVCAGWKGKFNLEDTLFAGAVADQLLEQFDIACDATLGAVSLFRSAKSDLMEFLSHSSHVQRLGRLGIDEDVKFCLTMDQYHVIPVLKGDKLVKLQ